MTFQLYSHSHLYEDAAAGVHSRKYPKKSSKQKKMNSEDPTSPVLQLGPLSPREPDVLEPPRRRSESLSPFPRSPPPAPDLSNDNSVRELPLQNTVRVVHPLPRGNPTPGIPMHRTETAASDRSDLTLTEGEEHPNPLGQEAAAGSANDKEADLPQLSWFMTLFIIAVVSVVRTKYTPHQQQAFNRLLCSWSPSPQIGW